MDNWHCTLEFWCPGAKQIYDVLAALFCKHIFDLDKLFAR